jgi:hypothetical protein
MSLPKLSEMSVNFCQTTWRHIPDDSTRLTIADVGTSDLSQNDTTECANEMVSHAVKVAENSSVLFLACTHTHIVSTLLGIPWHCY